MIFRASFLFQSTIIVTKVTWTNLIRHTTRNEFYFQLNLRIEMEFKIVYCHHVDNSRFSCNCFAFLGWVVQSLLKNTSQFKPHELQMEALVAPIFCWKKITITLQQMSKQYKKMYTRNVWVMYISTQQKNKFKICFFGKGDAILH